MLVEHTTNMENHQLIQLGTAHPSNVPCIFPQKMTTKSTIWLGTLSSSFAPHFLLGIRMPKSLRIAQIPKSSPG